MAGTKTVCNICNLTLNSYEQFVVHQAGKAHKRKEQQAGSTPTVPQQPVTKIVRGRPFIRFVTSKADNGSSEASQTQTTEGSTEQMQVSGAQTANDGSQYCTVCVVKLTSQALADMHFAGAKHRRNVALKEGTVGEQTGEGVKRKYEEMCEVCNVPLLTKTVAEAHYAGSKHEKKFRLSQELNAVKVNQPPSFTGLRFGATSQGSVNKKAKVDKVQPPVFYCAFCKVILNSQLQMDAHRLGAKHKNAANGLPQPRKKIFKPRQPQEHQQQPDYRPQQQDFRQQQQQEFRQEQEYAEPQEYRAPQSYNRFANFGSGTRFQAGHFGNPHGPVAHMSPVTFRPGPPLAYPASQY